MEMTEEQMENLKENFSLISKIMAEITCSLEDVRCNLLITGNYLDNIFAILSKIVRQAQEGPS